MLYKSDSIEIPFNKLNRTVFFQIKLLLQTVIDK